MNAYETGRIVGSIIGSLVCFGISIFAVVAIILAFVRRTKLWIVLASITVFLAFAGVVTIGAFAFHEIRNRAQASKNLKTIISDDGWVSLEVPGSWKEIASLSPEATVQFGNTSAEEYLTVFSDARSDFRGSLDEFARFATERMRDNLKGASLGPAESMEINGLPAIQVKLEGTADNVQISYLHTSVETPDGFHQVVQWTLPSKQAKAFPIFEKVAASFRTLRAKPQPSAPNPTPAIPRLGEQL